MKTARHSVAFLALLLLSASCSGQDPNLAKGKELFEAGDFTQALDFLGKALDKDPKSAEVLIWMARTHEKLEDDGRALLGYQMALSLDSTNTELLMAIGDLSIRNGHYKSSLPYYERVLLSPDAEKYATRIMRRVGYSPYRRDDLFPGLYLWEIHLAARLSPARWP